MPRSRTQLFLLLHYASCRIRRPHFLPCCRNTLAARATVQSVAVVIVVIRRLIPVVSDPEERRRLGEAGHRRVTAYEVSRVSELFLDAVGLPTDAVPQREPSPVVRAR